MVNTWNGATCELCDRKRCTVCTFDDGKIELRLKTKTEWFIEERSGITGRWYPICNSCSENEAINECKRLRKKNGDYYRVISVVVNDFD